VIVDHGLAQHAYRIQGKRGFRVLPPRMSGKRRG
jgi:hypothetical protein